MKRGSKKNQTTAEPKDMPVRSLIGRRDPDDKKLVPINPKITHRHKAILDDYAAFIDEDAQYVIQQAIEILGRDKPFIAWRKNRSQKPAVPDGWKSVDTRTEDPPDSESQIRRIS